MRRPYFKKSHAAWYVNVGSRPLRLGETKELADRAFERLLASQQGDYLVSELVAKFLAHHKAHSSVQTYRYYAAPLEAFRARFSELRVSDLKTFMLTEWVDSEAAPCNLIRAAKTCLHWAEKQSYISQSPLRNLKPPAATSRGDWVYLSADQWAQLIRALPSDLVDLVTAMRETGCRPQEIRQVEARHLDRIGRCWVFPTEESKGKREPRIIHLSHNVYEMCIRLALKYPNGPLFRNSEGRAWSTAALDGRFIRLSKKLGFRVVPYAMRHTFATDAIMRGVDLITIARLLGHADTKMLTKVYSHIQQRNDHLRSAIEKIVA